MIKYNLLQLCLNEVTYVVSFISLLLLLIIFSYISKSHKCWKNECFCQWKWLHVKEIPASSFIKLLYLKTVVSKGFTINFHSTHNEIRTVFQNTKLLPKVKMILCLLESVHFHSEYWKFLLWLYLIDVISCGLHSIYTTKPHTTDSAFYISK